MYVNKSALIDVTLSAEVCKSTHRMVGVARGLCGSSSPNPNSASVI